MSMRPEDLPPEMRKLLEGDEPEPTPEEIERRKAELHRAVADYTNALSAKLFAKLIGDPEPAETAFGAITRNVDRTIFNLDPLS